MSASTPTAPTRRPPGGLPLKVATRLAGRADAIRERDLGRVLDLSSLDARGFPATSLGGAPLTALGERSSFDAVISVGELVRFADLPAALGSLGSLLRPGGEMWLLEPIGRPGLGAAALAWLWSASPSLAGLELCRDVPAAVRATGMAITDLERFTVGDAPWPLREFVQLRATWVLAPGAPGPAGSEGRPR